MMEELKVRKSGGAVILMKNVNVKYLAGGEITNVKPLPPYSDEACEFLADLSKRLQKDRRASQYPDVISFAFFCRKANIAKLKSEFEDGRVRLGRGIVFHIAPSNVPVNSAFTYVFGLLAGNANIVRVSSKEFEQVKVICNVMQEMFDSGNYERVREMTAFVSYGRDTEINDEFSKMADVRIIWGGDRTISEIRKSPISSKCTEITFADRYSFGVFDAEEICSSSDEEIRKLAEKFYNDTYLMDQNACSTPHLIFWKSNAEELNLKAKSKFWAAVHKSAQKYDLADIKVSDKYVMLCEYACELDGIQHVEKYDNLLYTITLEKLPEDITALRGKFGLFFQYDIENIEEIAKYITNKVQTCIYIGVKKEELQRLIQEKSLIGIDRIVPVGASLDIGVIWDGYDIIGQMSRIISAV